MRTLTVILIGAVISLCLIANAAFPTHNNVCTNNLDLVIGDYNAFYWTWLQEDDQQCTFWFTNKAGWVDLNNMTVGMKIVTQTVTGPIVRVEKASTLITSSVYYQEFTIARTNMPPPGTHRLEIWAYEGTASNAARTLTQGKIDVKHSLFGD